MKFANVDLERLKRQGTAETLFGEGKTSEQIVEIAKTLVEAGQEPVLVTRINEEKAKAIKAAFSENFAYFPEGRIGRIGKKKSPDGIGKIVVVTAGTSDIPVAQEAIVTAESLGNEVLAIFDVGVAGLHRLLARLDDLRSASAIIAVAGMEGALASVIGGLVACPVVAVPTSVGYGASFGGIAALLSMLNSCAAGVSVVNIDNGFGAGILASRINHAGMKGRIK